MALQINNNMAALTAHRFLQTNDSNMGKAIERLSSGFRINSAADDAAGLVISEGFRTTISGLVQASRNSQDGINMLKTAEKALDEQVVQLRKIRDLVLHASNNTGNTSALAADQAEINQAVAAIDRIATSTKFGNISLLNSGTDNIANRYFQIGSESAERVQFTLPSTFAGETISANMTALNLGITQSAAGAGPTTTLADTAAYAAGAASNFKFVEMNFTRADGTAYRTVSTFAADTANVAAAVTQINNDLSAAFGADFIDDASAAGVFKAVDGGGGKLQFRATTLNTADQSTNASLSVVSYSTDGSVTGFESGQTVSGTANTTVRLDVEDTSANWTNYLSYVDSALSKVNGLRVNLGAFQKNNLESNMARIAVAKENLQASESAIRDTDMASEMVNFTKSQILMQAGQAMMSQANSAPQSLLQMLRG